MLIYLSHRYDGKSENYDRAMEIVHDLQVNDTDNCYICPLLAFAAIERGEIGYSAELEIRKDALTACDKLIVASSISQSVQEEIDLAERCHMPIEYL